MTNDELLAVMDDEIKAVSHRLEGIGMPVLRETIAQDLAEKTAIRAAVAELIAERDALLKASEWQDIASDPREFGAGIEISAQAKHWRDRSQVWMHRAIEIGWDAENKPAPPAGLDKGN